MKGWTIAAIAAGLVALGILGWSLARLAKALKNVRHGLEELAKVVPAAQRVNGEVDQWRSATGQIPDN